MYDKTESIVLPNRGKAYITVNSLDSLGFFTLKNNILGLWLFMEEFRYEGNE